MTFKTKSTVEAFFKFFKIIHLVKYFPAFMKLYFSYKIDPCVRLLISAYS
jgi:hypothetical protein